MQILNRKPQLKYEDTNPVARRLVQGYFKAFSEQAEQLNPQSILEVGCGKGHVVAHLRQMFPIVRCAALDIDWTELNESTQKAPYADYLCGSAYGLPFGKASFDLVICVEVLEHLEEPHLALEEMRRVAAKHLILSVPHEPIWRALNIARGVYWPDWGNTPGHIQHWSTSQFARLLADYFRVIKIVQPLPWTMVLCEAFADS